MLNRAEHLSKEIIEALTRAARRRCFQASDQYERSIIDKLKQEGVVALENYWSQEKCAAAVTSFDRLSESHDCKYWADENVSDERWYESQKASEEFTDFFTDPFIDSIRTSYSGHSQSDSTLLAARMTYKPGNTGSGNGWHRDSPHRSQFKAILYLSDVSEETGPFQYIAGSQRFNSAYQMFRKKMTLPNQYRFEEKQIEEIKSNHEVTTFCAPAGTLLLVDSKGIHRGKPMTEGARYALTLYCFDGPRPSGFIV